MTLRCGIGYRNSFQTILRGRLRDDSDGTHVRCTFGMNRFVIVFMCIWFGGIVSIGGAAAVAALIDLATGRKIVQGSNAAAIGVPLGMVAFGVALLKFGSYLARNERPQLIEFLKQNLEAHEISGSVLQ